MASSGSAFKIGEKTVTWTWSLGHSAQVLVTRTDYYPYNWSADIQSNGTLVAKCQLGDFYISAIKKQSEGPIPDGGITTGYPMVFYLSFGLIGDESHPIVYKLPVGTHIRAICGVLSVTAVCDVMYDLIDLGQHGWPLDGEDVPSVIGPLYDTPNNTKAKVYLQLKENATYSMVTNYGTYSDELLLTEGVILENRLWALAQVEAVSKTQPASGVITVTNSLGAYRSVGSNQSWTHDTATCSGGQATGAVEAEASNSDGFEAHAKMTCTWSMEREANLDVYICDQSGEGIDADLFITRYADDELPNLGECVDGEYSEGITQTAYLWNWEATHRGSSAPAPNEGGAYNWGDLKLALDSSWNEGEQQELPSGWANVGSPYLTHRDGFVPFHTFNFKGLVDIAQTPDYGPRIGYAGGNYSLSSNVLTATGGAENGAQVGTWSVSDGATVELDNTGQRILIKPAAATACVAKRTLELTPAQCGSSPLKPARDAWTGFRWLTIVLEPVDIETGVELETVGQSVLLEVEQDDMAAYFDEPDVQTWTSGTNKIKHYSAVTKRVGNVTFIDVDLANPVSPSTATDGGNPPATGNYGDTGAKPNVMSHYPKPTQDAAHGGVTNACEVKLTLPFGSWWKVGDFVLHHKLAEVPKFSLMPGYNQWFRKERRDKINDEDFAEAKKWGRRLLYSNNEGLLGVEAFDIDRNTQYSIEDGCHQFGYTAKSVLETVEVIAEIEQIKHYPSGAEVGAIRLYPGWSYSVTPPVDEIELAKFEHVMLVGCHLGGRGITWTSENRICWSNLSLSDYGLGIVVQGLTNALDWFGGAGDVFGVADGVMTGPTTLRAATVLRGAVDGGVSTGRSYTLYEYERPSGAPSTIKSLVAPDDFGHLRISGGKPKKDHDVIPTGSALKVEFDNASTIVWELPTDMVTEAPSWWEHRGCYRCYLYGSVGVNRPRYRGSDGAPLCQKVGVGRTNEGRCVFCPHGV